MTDLCGEKEERTQGVAGYPGEPSPVPGEEKEAIWGQVDPEVSVGTQGTGICSQNKYSGTG